ncbi:MAG TPA: YfhO family protein, partial [Verrucomicrobiae bacterium]|nr:YfhO family protein [Verrucomicrobiae bacterium]
LWILQLVSDEFPRKFFWRFPAIVLLIIALAAAQLLPFLDLAAHSQRQAGYADLRWSMPGTGWINLLVPMFAGHTGTEGIFFQPGQYWTSSYYLGLGCLWLALVAVIGFRTSGDARRKILLLAALAAVAFIFALGENTPVLPALRRFLPQLALVTYPVKYFLLVTFIAPLLAAFGLSRLENLRRPTIGIGIVLFLLIAAILAWLWKFQPAGDETRTALLNGWSRLGFLAVIAAILVGSMKASGSPLVRITTPLLLALIAWVDVLTHEPTQNPTVTPNVFAPNLAREDLKMQPQPELGRSRAMVSPKAYLGFIHLSLPDPKNNFLAKRLGYCANCNLLDGVPKVDGFFSLSLREYDDVFSLMYSATNEFDGLENFLGVSQITAPDQVFHWRARTNYLPLVTAGQLPVFLDDADTLAALAQPGFDGSKVVFLPRDTRLPMSITNRSNAQISGAKFDIDQVQFDAIAAAPALVVVAQSYDSNWRAFVDGRSTPLLRANDAFQAVEIAPGKHQVKLKYNDRAFEIGAAISLATLLFFLGVLALPRKPA